MLAPSKGAGWRAAFASVVASVLLMACATHSGPPSPEQAAADLQSHIEQAQAARQSGDLPKAAALLQDAARSNPTSKQPWVKLAQMQFEAGNYSAAIVAAEDALQRDASDATALSVLSVSGLRIAANSLQQLRKASAVSGSTRVEAEALAHTIRESLGEDVLVPGAPGAPTTKASGATGSVASATGGRTRASSANRAAAVSTRTPAPDKATTATTATAGGRNPFNVLQ